MEIVVKLRGDRGHVRRARMAKEGKRDRNFNMLTDEETEELKRHLARLRTGQGVIELPGNGGKVYCDNLETAETLTELLARARKKKRAS